MHGLTAFLPDGRHFLYLRVTLDGTTSGIFIGDINRKPAEQDVTRLLAASHAVYGGAGDRGAGYLLYLRQGTLVSHAFDAGRLALVGDASPVAEGVGNTGALGFFAVGGDVGCTGRVPRGRERRQEG